MEEVENDGYAFWVIGSGILMGVGNEESVEDERISGKDIVDEVRVLITYIGYQLSDLDGETAWISTYSLYYIFTDGFLEVSKDL
jgi:hypothetical protein